MSIESPGPLTVAVEHAEPLVAAGVCDWLTQDPTLHVLAAADGDRADVVVMDYAAGMARLGVRRALRDAPTPPRVLVVTAERREYEVRRALEAGIDGYLINDCEPDELSRCVRALGAGLRYFSLSAAQAMADSLTREALTSREQEVLALLMRGHNNKAIARALGIALGTVKSHLKALMAKLDAHSRTEVVAVASARGLGLAA